VLTLDGPTVATCSKFCDTYFSISIRKEAPTFSEVTSGRLVVLWPVEKEVCMEAGS
jgi:hypothetical protein